MNAIALNEGKRVKHWCHLAVVKEANKGVIVHS